MGLKAERPAIGQIIDDKYEVTRVLGEGGMGVVFEAMHTKIRQRVAIKVLLPELLGMEEVVGRFEREARAAGQLRGRHVARVHDVDHTAEGLPYMVMDFLEGHDLGTELESRLHLPVDESVGYVLQACLALQEAHQLGIVHRDLKPANLFLAREESGQVVKLLDFGISKVVHEADRLTAADTVMGTAMYMSPEQVRSSAKVDGRSDVWSLGIILYELLCGRPPFMGTTTQVAAAIVSDEPPPMSTWGVSVPADLEAIVLMALSRSPSARFQTVRELGSALFPYAGVYGLGLEAFSHVVQSHRAMHPTAEQTGRVRSVDNARTEMSSSSLRPPLGLQSLMPNRTEGAWTDSGGTRHAKSRNVALASLVVLGLLTTVAALGVARERGTVTRASDTSAETGLASVPTSHHARGEVTSMPIIVTPGVPGARPLVTPNGGSATSPVVQALPSAHPLTAPCASSITSTASGPATAASATNHTTVKTAVAPSSKAAPPRPASTLPPDHLD